MQNYIQIRGAKVHNLKNIDLDIPRDKLVVITGVSGSGKSSLAFDTIYSEGQRRYMNTLSSYAKHFMTSLEKPDVESIEGLSPVIAIGQKTSGSNPRSTVGTITEIYDFLRLLYAKASTAYSPVTGKEMISYTDEQIVDLLLSAYKDRKTILLSPLVNGRKGNYKELFSSLRKKGYAEVRIDGQIADLGEIEEVDRYKNHFIELVVDKLRPQEDDLQRLRSSISSALSLGKGNLMLIDVESEEIKHYSKNLICPDSGISLPQIAPHSFSFNSPQGYCPHCKGLGVVSDVSIDSLIPNHSLSIAQGGIVPLGEVRLTRKFDIIRSIARKYNFSIYEPINKLPSEIISLLLYGSDEMYRVGEGVMAEMVPYKGLMDEVEKNVVCPVCNGTRLRKETQYFKLCDLTISEVCDMELEELKKFLTGAEKKLSHKKILVSKDIISTLIQRVDFLLNVGLDYLSLSRSSSSLSGGEMQRIRLATQIGTKLTGVLYVLDEPSIGLHQSDNIKLIKSLQQLRDEGNSIIVVEHDAQTMLQSDWLVDIGPGAGENGGSLCYNGKIEDIDKGNSLTLDYLKGRRDIELPESRRKGNGKILSLRGASGNNLKNVDIDLPLGCLIGISGLSGSGKSSLINQTLMPVLKNAFYNGRLPYLPYKEIIGLENIDKVIEIDQKPVGRSPKSNPATYTEVFNDIRLLYENTIDAKVRGFKAGKFSFNVSGGRCEECKGAGIKMIEMNFLPSVNILCPKCKGKRYMSDVLSVRYKGKNISQVLNMTVSQAREFFAHIPKIEKKLQTMIDVGLGYVKLGQSTLTLSGGETQRMKLAGELAKTDTGNTLYLLDEPTTGLHFEDIKILLHTLNSLVDKGNTIVIIEHNLDVLKSMDYIFDIGPLGGKKGGEIIAKGTPEEIASNPSSLTGQFLKNILTS